mmetsp:Transcript_13325/g.18203  ORF Transcript_13325/g.18203 Transcript_13325/m.18203 type:complete len:406 (-) Transcript_13325:121-1338(-)
MAVRPLHIIAILSLGLMALFAFSSFPSTGNEQTVVYNSPQGDEKVASLTRIIGKLHEKVTDLEKQSITVQRQVNAVGKQVGQVQQAQAQPSVALPVLEPEEPQLNSETSSEDLEGSKVPLSQRSDISRENMVQKGSQADGKHSWTNPETKDTYMKMYNEYHRLRSGYDSCHGCRYLPALYKTYKFDSVFDAGCGTGFLVRELLKSGKEAYGVEAASLPLETYAKDLLDNNTVFIRPLHMTPFKDEYFDFILSTEVFEHVPMADVDRSIKELYRVAKPGAKAFVTIGMGTSRFDTKDGRKKSDVAGFDMSFKFHETVQTRRWWLDTFCALGWYEDFGAYKQIVNHMIKAGYPQNIPPRGWMPLVKGTPGSKSCANTCTVAEGRRAAIWCGAGRKGKIDTSTPISES